MEESGAGSKKTGEEATAGRTETLKSCPWELWSEAYPKEEIFNDGTSGNVTDFFFF